MRRIFFCITVLAGLLAATECRAIELPELISDNMVLQQNSQARLWGWSKKGKKVVVTPSWNNQKYTTTAGKDGRWEVEVATPEASFQPYRIAFTDGDSAIEAKNVLIGEVWFASGQSNMEMPLNGFWTQPVEGSNRAIAYSGQYPGIRMVTLPKRGALTPQQRISGKWQVSSPENAQWFSAVGYFFAQTLAKMLNVPVGIINCSWGGSHVEGWLPEEELKKYPDVDLKAAADTTVREYDRPLIMYNGMLSPVIGYTVKGFIWNQGESNVGHHDVYAVRLARMVEIWREKFGQGALPFYCVEIPPYSYGDINGVQGALLREAQHEAANMIPNSGIVCTNDLSYPHEQEIIHPSRKQEIGERLAWMAAVRSYGIKGVGCDSPEFESMDVDGNTAILHFRNASDGVSPDRDLQGFEVAGADRVFYPAKACEIFDSRTIKVESDKVQKIESVRYRFKNWSPGNIYSLRGLPLVPFRTDRWNDK